ncbi:glycosyltransferase family 4 protein [soil metagenome]
MDQHRKKIAVIDMDDLRSSLWGSGQARATREVFKRLTDTYDITIYTSKYPGYEDYTDEGLKYVHIGLNNKNPQLTNIYFLANIPFFVRTIKAELIVENFNAPTSVSFSPTMTDIPVVGIPTMFNAIEFTKKYHLPFHWIEQWGMKYYKYMTAYSDIDSAKIQKLNPKTEFRIIPQGVGEEFFDIPHAEPKHILFLGRLDIWQKGVDLLLESYAKIADRIGYPLVIAGHGSDEKKLKELAKKLNIEDKISFTGGAYGDAKTKLISEALFVAFPSRHDELSLWALEALASGMPIVSFDLPEGRWMSDSVALKAPAFDTDAYAAQLLQATDPTINAKMRQEARTFAKTYTWDKVVAQYKEFFEYIINKEQQA